MTGSSSSQIDYSVYQPRIAVDVEISRQRDGDRIAFMIGPAFVGRYLISPSPKVGKA
jgi:hypothetical protein